MSDRIEVDRGEGEQPHFWRYVHENGNEIFRSSETYANAEHALDQAEDLALRLGVDVYVRCDDGEWAQLVTKGGIAVDLQGGTAGAADAAQSKE